MTGLDRRRFEKEQVRSMAEGEQDFGQAETVGQRLRVAREAKGLTLEDVASQTRIPIRHLRSIEDSQWEDLPAVTYTVGFGRSYANVVGLDGAEIGRELREQLGTGQPQRQVSPQFYDPPDPSRVPSRSLAWIAGLLLVALVAAYLIWRSQLNDDDAPEAPVAQQVEQQPQQVAEPQQQAPQNLTGQQVTLVASEQVWFQVNDRASGNRLVRAGELGQGQEYSVPLDVRQPVLRTSRPQALRVRVGNRELGALGTREGLVKDVSLLATDVANYLSAQQGAGPAR
jgi:transcriptional regulator with XRE-family HTH domain